MSLRLKITVALVISSLIAVISVGLIARWMVTRHLSDVAIDIVFGHFQDDMVAFYQTYGSWKEAFRREHFTNFVVRRRGEFTTDRRTPLKPIEKSAPVLNKRPAPLPPPLGETAAPPKRPPHHTPPVRFILVDPQGRILHPIERAGERLPGAWRADALPVRHEEVIIAYALAQGEVQLSTREIAYLRALIVALAYAVAMTLPVMIVIGLLWGHRLARPLHKLTDALRAMQDGQLKQQVVIHAHDEIGVLTENFNQTSAQLARAYADLEAAKQAADAANHAKSAFLSNMSHELRTPLNAVIGFAQLSCHTLDLPLQVREYLNIIQKSGEHLLQLINNVLSIARIEAGKLALDQRVFDVRLLLQDVQTMLAPQADAKELFFELGVAAATPHYVLGDEGKLRQVLINLLGNALKFTEQGGIGVQVDFRAPDRLLVEVSDTGVGIAAADLPKLFRPFEQTTSGAQQNVGVGLGLALSKRLIELMGGAISVDSKPGAGAVFTFHVQAEPTAASPSHVEGKRVIGLLSAPPPRLLVVDDSRESRDWVAHFLAFAGFEVRSVADGRQAIEQWREWQPDLISMDLRMPDLDGFETTRQIRAEAAAMQRQVVIIALSASAFEEDESRALAMGFDDFLRKPVAVEALFDCIAKHLGVRYRYDDIIPEPDDDGGMGLQAEALMVLPADWRAALAAATRKADFMAIQQLISELDETHRSIEERLTMLLHQYDYDTLYRLASRSGDESQPQTS